MSRFAAVLLALALFPAAPSVSHAGGGIRGYNLPEFQARFGQLGRDLAVFGRIDRWVKGMGKLETIKNRTTLRRLETEGEGFLEDLRKLSRDYLDLIIGMKSTRDWQLLQESTKHDENFMTGLGDVNRGVMTVATVVGMIRIRLVQLGG